MNTFMITMTDNSFNKVDAYDFSFRDDKLYLFENADHDSIAAVFNSHYVMSVVKEDNADDWFEAAVQEHIAKVQTAKATSADLHGESMTINGPIYATEFILKD